MFSVQREKNSPLLPAPNICTTETHVCRCAQNPERPDRSGRSRWTVVTLKANRFAKSLAPDVCELARRTCGDLLHGTVLMRNHVLPAPPTLVYVSDIHWKLKLDETEIQPLLHGLAEAVVSPAMSHFLCSGVYLIRTAHA